MERILGKFDKDQLRFIRLSYLLALFLGLTFWGKAATDPDLGWHLFGGAWIANHHALPSFDPVNSLNSTWHDYHWFAQLLFYALYLAGGYELLRAFTGLLLGYLLVVLLDIFYLSQGQKKSVLLATLGLVCATLLLFHVTSVRPQLLSVLFVALSFRTLLAPKRAYELPFLLVLGTIHVNLHVYWVFIPFLYFSMRVLPKLVHRRSLGTEFVGLLLLSLVGVVSPYGLENYTLLYDYISMPQQLRTSISELSPGFSSSEFVVAALLAYLVLLARLVRTRYCLARPGITLCAIVAPLLAIRAIKFLPIFVIFGFPFVMRHGGVAIRKLAPSIFKRESLPAKLSLVSILLLAAFLTIREMPWVNPKLEHLHAKYPLVACKILGLTEMTPTVGRDHIRVLTNFNYGGWCRWELYLAAPEKDFRVTTDGRTQFVPWERFRESFELFRVGPGWRESLEKLDTDAAVVAADSALNQILPKIPSWIQIYNDKNFALYRHSR